MCAGGNGLAYRICTFSESDEGSKWLPPEYVGCGEDDAFDLPELSEVFCVNTHYQYS